MGMRTYIKACIKEICYNFVEGERVMETVLVFVYGFEVWGLC